MNFFMKTKQANPEKHSAFLCGENGFKVEICFVCFCLQIFTKGIQAMLNELESESDISPLSEG